MTLFTEKPKTVYFIRPIGMQGPIKIGCSISPDGRRMTLETWCPFPLEIIAEIAGCLDIERQFHSLFRAQHRGREWFDWSPELQATIDAVAAGHFDLATLPEAVPFDRKRRRGGATFRDANWRFTRSVDGRLAGARRRGAPRDLITQLLGMDHWQFVSRLGMNGPDVHELRLSAKTALDELDRRFPRRHRLKPLTLPESDAA